MAEYHDGNGTPIVRDNNDIYINGEHWGQIDQFNMISGPDGKTYKLQGRDIIDVQNEKIATHIYHNDQIAILPNTSQNSHNKENTSYGSGPSIIDFFFNHPIIIILAVCFAPNVFAGMFIGSYLADKFEASDPTEFITVSLAVFFAIEIIIGIIIKLTRKRKKR